MSFPFHTLADTIHAAGGYGYVYLFKDYRTAASELLMSVDELKATQAVRSLALPHILHHLTLFSLST